MKREVVVVRRFMEHEVAAQLVRAAILTRGGEGRSGGRVGKA
jgi:hypothetical protein